MTNSTNSSNTNSFSDTSLEVTPVTRDDFSHRNGCADTPPADLDQEFLRVLKKLDRAWQFSQDCDRSGWDFAVELSDLGDDGVTHETLRWMLGKGLIEHAIEAENHQGIGRSFESRGGFKFSQRSCFVITRVGHELAIGGAAALAPPPDNCTACPLPVWDDQRHELRLGATIVKRFRWRASNQEAVLAAFQEEGWPPRIDDPLPPVAETDPKRRLSDAIKCLNRKQKNPLMRFSGDGTGQGILWDVVAGPAHVSAGDDAVHPVGQRALDRGPTVHATVRSSSDVPDRESRSSC